MPAVTVAELNQRIQGRLAGVLGVRIVEVAADRAVAELEVRSELMNTIGSLHAAAFVAIADTTCGAGTIRALPEAARGFTTLELKSNFVGTAREGTLRCEARLRHGGRTTQLWEASVFGGGKPLAFFSCTQLILYQQE
jgi:1,4-dihydroxy-2-naphthoyl-CoA hydrolase